MVSVGLWTLRDLLVIPLYSRAFTVTFQEDGWSPVITFQGILSGFLWWLIPPNTLQSVVLSRDGDFAKVM